MKRLGRFCTDCQADIRAMHHLARRCMACRLVWNRSWKSRNPEKYAAYKGRMSYRQTACNECKADIRSRGWTARFCLSCATKRHNADALAWYHRTKADGLKKVH